MGILGGSDSIVDPAARDKYLLQVTAGPSYTESTHTQVPVNGSAIHKVDNETATSYIRVRIKDYHGLPRSAPPTCPYFTHPLHTSDRYSVAFSFVPKRDIPGSDLIMGFDFSHPVRDRLPPGTKTAVKIATTMLDPGLYADPYSDEPYLYGPALSSVFTLRIGAKTDEQSAEAQLSQLDSENEGVIEEGASGSGTTIRSSQNIPTGWKARRKFFLDDAALQDFVFEEGRIYHADFFNPHLDFSNFSLRLPGFSISVAKYVDEKTHHLRFVLKNRREGDVLFVVFFKLLFGRELDDTLRNNNDDDEEDETTHSSQPLPPPSPQGTPSHQDETPRRQSTQRQLLGGSRAPSFQEPSGFAAPQSFTRGDESEYTLNAAANTLAQSISAAFSAMGFGGSKDEDADGVEDAGVSYKSHAKAVEGMDDGAVEGHLRDRNGSVS
ncbi:hypothetical protein N0V94_006821 [Neodidymelliopsis sp. IMI 364377]|nr:hypothetical protein N0V94_006821 [Neodidymelliopsis sp. IMI 364377]